MATVRFVTTAYGNKYVGFLLVCIYSIVKNNPNAAVTVIWQDIDQKYINLMQKAFLRVLFKKVDFTIHGEFLKKISNKTVFWEYAVMQHPGENICLLDSDMLVLKPVDHFFEESFDIAFTFKKEKFPLNTGVLLIKNTPATINFFTSWKEATDRILSDQALFVTSLSSHYPYGGADQMALHQMLQYTPEKNDYEVIVQGNAIRFHGVPCPLLNETNSVPVLTEQHILHYKGGWRNILVDGTNFTRNRPKRNSFMMYQLFLRTAIEAVTALKAFDPSLTLEEFSIAFPPYLDRATFKENKFRYHWFYCHNAVKMIIEKFKILRKRARLV